MGGKVNEKKNILMEFWQLFIKPLHSGSFIG